jgi:hypothetical protein
MWKKATLIIIVLIGAILIAMLSFQIGGSLPGWLLLFYVPFVFIGAGIAKWASLGFKRGRKPISN